ncbi:MAG: phosphoadenosine phosphosulfate reductase family protein [Fibrobacter sp.]|nr:phosphoadenosine phosphosulfate reductase family protein [Fibrobacter sp.]
MSEIDNKICVSLDRLIIASDMAFTYTGAPLHIMISGGKDSSVLQQLAIESGIKCAFVHSLTTVDAPETIYFIREEFERLRGLGYNATIRRPPKSMWQLIEDKYGMPPLRTMRYCCKYLKERPVCLENGKRAFIATGVRWAESTRRKSRAPYEAIASNPKNALRVQDNEIILSEDNDLGRKLFENCRLKGERVVNPIIDWTDADIWEFIRNRGLPYNPLYDEGFKRIGCIGCPMANKVYREKQFERWPQFKAAYIRALDAGIKKGKAAGKEYTWEGGEDALRFLDG